MLRATRRSAVVLLALVLLLLSGTTVFAKNDGVPFKASFSGSAVLTSPTTIVFAGTGNASHLGRISDTGNVLVTGPDGRCTGGVTAVNTETLTAANGDTLTVTSHDVTCLTGPGQYHGTGQWTVTGGTGRFSGASGAGTFDGIADLVAQTFTIALTGSLDY